MIHVWAGWSRISSHYSERCTVLKTHELLISGMSRLIFLSHGQPRATEIVESEAVDKGGLL